MKDKRQSDPKNKTIKFDLPSGPCFDALKSIKNECLYETKYPVNLD